jgi:hypothetical protein
MVATVGIRTCYAAGVPERELWEIVDRLEWTLRPYEAGESTPTPQPMTTTPRTWLR